MTTVRTLLLAGASLLASIAAASAADAVRPAPKIIVPAAPPALAWDAYVSAGFGQLSGSGTSVTRRTFQGSAETMLGQGFGVQADVLGDQLSGFGTTVNANGGAVHLFLRSPAWLLGAFGQYKSFSLGTSVNSYYEGVEAQYLAPANWSLYGRVAANQINGTGSSISGWDALGKVRVFLVPNWMVDLRVGYSSFSGPTAANTTMFGAGTEFRLAGPFSVFGEYEHLSLSGAPLFGGTSSNFWEVGVKLNVGAPTLQARDKMGASLEPVKGYLSIIR